MKDRWRTCEGLAFLMILGIISFLFMQSQKQATLPPQREDIVQKHKRMQGTISKIEDTLITVHNDIEEITFEVTEDCLALSSLVVQDEVIIRYVDQPSATMQKAEAVTLMKQHKNSLYAYMDTMTLEEKVGQMIMARCPDDGSALQDVQTYGLGAYMLFAENIEGKEKDTLKEELASYQNASLIPLLIAVDEEGGTVNRLSKFPAFRSVPFSSPQDLYKEGGMDRIRSDLKEKAELLLSLGIQVNLAPVADVSTNPEDFIYERSFGKPAQESAAYIHQVIKQSKQMHLGTALKHFPGYGNNVDTHTGIAYDQRSMESFRSSDFLPFIAGIEAGADSILVAHNIVTCMDEVYPASLSKNVHRILRGELQFDGVIMSDDLDMDAISDIREEMAMDPAVLGILAGNDMILTSRYRTQIPLIVKAVEQGEIEVAQINQSVYRILLWKQHLGLITDMPLF